MKKSYLLLSSLACVCIGYYLAKENYEMENERFVYQHPLIPKSFDGTKILHLSDLHEIELGKKSSKITYSYRCFFTRIYYD